MTISHEKKEEEVRVREEEEEEERVILSSVVSTKVWPFVAIYGTQRYYTCTCTQTFVFLLFSDTHISSLLFILVSVVSVGIFLPQNHHLFVFVLFFVFFF